MQPHADTALQALAEEAVVYAYPLYEMCRMRAATSPQRTDAVGALVQCVHARTPVAARRQEPRRDA